MARDAWYFLVPLLAVALLGFLLGWIWAGVIILALAAFIVFFFRDPDRLIPDDPRAIVSPADGRVIKVQSAPEGGCRLSIFLSVFNVHVNRAPIAGVIVRQEHKAGKFYVASDDRASLQNEQLVLTIRGERELSFALIAGILARRIVPWLKPGDSVAKGDRIALIRFGSRVDMLIPGNCDLTVNLGERVRAGSSIVARWREDR